MTRPFSRTPTGIVGKWRFHGEPTIWVEGPSDIYFYFPIVSDLPCRLEPFHGIENARALIAGLREHNFPYVVILDGDYEILNPRRQPHRRVIGLKRYSFENYLWEKEPFNSACLRHAQCGERNEYCFNEVDRVEHQLQHSLIDAVVLDIAARNEETPPKVLPERIEALLAVQGSTDIDRAKVDGLMASVKDRITDDRIVVARAAVEKFVAEHRFVDLLRGHLLFGVLRLMFTKLTTKLRGSRSILTDDGLTQLLSDAVWRRSPSHDHSKLKAALRKRVRECMPRFSHRKV